MINYSLDPKGERLPLDGVTLGEEAVYIRLEDTGTIKVARFFLNDILVQTCRGRFGFNFKGVTVFGNPRAATFADGQHTIRVEIDHRDGQQYEESASFSVGSPQPVGIASSYPVGLSIHIGGQTLTMTLTLSVDGDGHVTGLS